MHSAITAVSPFGYSLELQLTARTLDELKQANSKKPPPQTVL
jgi:hypothetical protein